MYQCCKNTMIRHGCVRLLCPLTTLLLVIFGLTTLSRAEYPQQTVTPSLFGLSEWDYTSSKACQSCHPDHYDMWAHSMHALSVDDPIFQVSFLQAQVEKGDSARKMCLSCHAPIAVTNRDYSMSMEYTREGVSCDFCHSVTEVHIGRETLPYDCEPGATKFGPIKAQYTPAHKSHQSELFKSSTFCGGCHELINEHGVVVMGTYSEWRDSPYPEEGVHCQNCHMPLSLKPTAVTAKGDSTENLAHDHRFQGGHSRINLKHAADLDLYTQIFERTAQVTVIVTNKESGHKLPTGMPARRVILNVEIYDQDNNLLAQPSRIYRKVLLDKDGTILEGNTNQILKAVKIFNDNRIAPKEKRKEEFLIDLPENVTSVNVFAELLYEYETPVMYTQKIQTEMAALRKDYPVQAGVTSLPGESSRQLWIIFFSLAVVLSLFIFVMFRLQKKSKS